MAVVQQEIEQARALAQQGNSDAAVAVLSQLIQRDASNVAAWLALSEVVDDPERAEYCLQKVLNLDPGNTAALEKLSQTKGGSLSVGSVGGLNHSDTPSVDELAPEAESEAPRAVDSDKIDLPEPVPEIPQTISEGPKQSDELPAPENPVETASVDAAGFRGPQAMEAQFESASAAPQNLAEILNTDPIEAKEHQDNVAQLEAQAPTPELLAEASNVDAEEPEGSSHSEAQLDAAAATPDEPAQVPAGGSSVSRTDLILIGLTVLAGIVLCALVSAALIT